VILRSKSPNRSCRFWGPNRKTWATSFEAKPGETVTTGVEAKLEKIIATSFEAKLEKTVTTGFEAKPEKTITVCIEAQPRNLSTLVLRLNQETRRPWFWGSTKKLTLLDSTWTVQTAQGVTQPLDRPTTE
jgi:hypothetical protein